MELANPSRDESTTHFHSLLDELNDRLHSRMKDFSLTNPVWNQATCKLVEEIYESWEKIYFSNGGEKLASEIADGKSEFLHALHSFIEAVFTGIVCMCVCMTLCVCMWRCVRDQEGCTPFIRGEMCGSV